MRFISFVQRAEGTGAPPPALVAARDGFTAECVASGQLLDGGDLHGAADAVSFVVRDGCTTRVDGPRVEVGEVVAGYAVLEFASHEDAVENTRRLAELHTEHWPGAQVTITLRRVSDGPPPEGG